MKAYFYVALAIAGFHAAPLLAASTPKSPLIGQWELDVGSLTTPPETRPKRVHLDFHETRDGKWASHVEIIDQRDNKLFSESTLSLDATPGKATGTYWVDVLAAKMPAPNVLVMQFVYQGIPRSTRIFSVGPDGNVLTETETYFSEDGTPVMRTAMFSRVLPKR